jgi:hypothetical protein
MEGHVLEISDQVQEDHGHDDCQPFGNGNGIKQPPAIGLAHYRNRNCRARSDDPQDGNVEHQKRNVMRPALEAAKVRAAPRSQHLPRCHRHKDHEECANAQQRFMYGGEVHRELGPGVEGGGEL